MMTALPSMAEMTGAPGAGVTQRERELAGIISAYNDVTDRLKVAHERLCDEVGRLREELRQKNEELRRSERLAALGEMAAGLAHEVRNPLGGIALYASMLERTLDGQPGAVTAGKIFQGVRSLEHLVCEILDFAQKDELEKRPCAMSDILPAVKDAIARTARDCQASFELDVPDDVRMLCDPTRIQRVLVNLMTNALQAAGSGGWARLAVFESDTGVNLEVTDSGPGIPEVNLHRVFNPFFTTKNSGTGLGLAICHRIVEAHGGTIRAGNIPGGGARFGVWLPSDAEDRPD